MKLFENKIYKKFIADTLAMIIFSTSTGMFIEVIVIDLTVNQSIWARIMATPVNLLTGRSQGVFYDWIFKLLKVNNQSSFFKKTIAEIIAFTLFQIPVNATSLKLAGASFSQILTSAIILIISSLFISKIYSIFLNYCRKLFKVS